MTEADRCNPAVSSFHFVLAFVYGAFGAASLVLSLWLFRDFGELLFLVPAFGLQVVTYALALGDLSRRLTAIPNGSSPALDSLRRALKALPLFALCCLFGLVLGFLVTFIANPPDTQGGSGAALLLLPQFAGLSPFLFRKTLLSDPLVRVLFGAGALVASIPTVFFLG